MEQLSSDDYPRILPLLRHVETRSHRACYRALLEGNQAGKVFVDRRESPSAALLCPVSGFYFVVGEADAPGFSRFLPELRRRHLVDKCAVFATSEQWRAALDPLLAHRVTRLGFHFQPLVPPEAAVLEPGFRLERMDARVRERWQAGLDPWVLDIYGGAAGFAERSFGFCVLHEERAVSIAAACAIGGGEAEVEVGTVPAYQGRGLARAACRAFLDECAVRRLTPTWSCSAGNAPSLALSRKLGFVPEEEIHGYPLEA